MVLLARGPRQPHGDGAITRPRPGNDPLSDLLRTAALRADRWSPRGIAALLGVLDHGLADAPAYGTFLTALLESPVRSRLGRLIRTAPADAPEVARIGRVGGRIGLDLLLGGFIVSGRRELVICIDLDSDGRREHLVAARWLQPAAPSSSRRAPDLEPTERLRALVRRLAPVGCPVRWLLTPRTPPRPGNRVGVHPLGRFRVEEP